MSWLAREESLSTDIFGWIALARDAQTRRQAEFLASLHAASGLPVVILGEAYKKDVNLVVGSPSSLLSSFLDQMGVGHIVYDPLTRPGSEIDSKPQLFFIATNHTEFQSLVVPSGSVAVDPWGNAIDPNLNPGVTFIRPGRDELRQNL